MATNGSTADEIESYYRRGRVLRIGAPIAAGAVFLGWLGNSILNGDVDESQIDAAFKQPQAQELTLDSRPLEEREADYGLGADIEKYIIAMSIGKVAYKNPILGTTGKFPRNCPEGYTGYINPVSGQMGWVPEDIEIPDGYAIRFSNHGRRFKVVPEEKSIAKFKYIEKPPW